MRTVLAVAIGKLLRFLLRLVRRGGGSALPGVIASKIDPRLLTNALQSCKQGLVVVSGSAGKSSTTFQLVELLRAHGLKVFTNPSTANIKQGLYAAVLKECNLRGEIDYDIAVMEWDEGHGAMLAKSFDIRLAILTNVLSDQLDRFVDPEVVVEKLKEISEHSKIVIANSDDKNLTQFLTNREDVFGFGLSHEGSAKASAPKYALNFGPHPEINTQVHVWQEDGFRVGFSDFSVKVLVDSPELALNYAAALLAASKLIELKQDLVRRQYESTRGVFARNEIAEVLGKRVNLRLVQNPTSFQLNLDELSGTESPLMLMAGRDIHDPSWLWTVDFSKLAKVDVVGGFNAYELALRLSVAGVEVGAVEPEIADATAQFFSLEGDQPTILFSADAMRRFRRHTKVAN